MPAPALVNVAAPLIMPEIVPAPLFVILKARLPVTASAIALAFNCAVVIVRPVSGVPPTAPENVVLPVVYVVSVFAPVTAALNSMLPIELVSVVAAPNVTAPV